MRKLLYNLLVVLLVFSLISCGEMNPAAGKPGAPDVPDDGGNTDTPTLPDGDGYEFSVSFVLGGERYIPDSPITVRWSNSGAVHSAVTDESGVAKIKGLDGNYSITLVGVPSGLMYNPNIYIATNNRRDTVIEFFEIVTPSDKDKGTNYVSDVIDLTRTGHYRLTLTNSKPTYFQFVPRSTGLYVIESWVDVTGNNINPIANHHEGSSEWKNPTPIVCDTGGVASTYTKNFKLQIEVAPSNLSSNGGVILCFGIYATIRDGEISKDNPVTVDFSIEYRGSVSDKYSEPSIKIPTELPRKDSIEYDVWNSTIEDWHARYSFAGKLHEAKDLGTLSGKTVILNDECVEYNEQTGFYHLYNPEKYSETDGYGPILYAHVTSRTLFIDSPLNLIEYAGNKALTVAPEENYKLFIEGYHALIVNEQANNPQAIGPYFCTNACPCRGDAYLPDGTCEGSCPESCDKCDEDCRHLPIEYVNRLGYAQYTDSNGLVPVTKELKEFLQKFATSQMLFKDGYGIAEMGTTPSFTAYEGSQWLFACAYYE